MKSLLSGMCLQHWEFHSTVHCDHLMQVDGSWQSFSPYCVFPGGLHVIQFSSRNANILPVLQTRFWLGILSLVKGSNQLLCIEIKSLFTFSTLSPRGKWLILTLNFLSSIILLVFFPLWTLLGGLLNVSSHLLFLFLGLINSSTILNMVKDQ